MLTLKMKINRGRYVCGFSRASLAVILILSGLLWPGMVRGGCTVSATGVNFGAYNTLDTVNLDSTGTITVACTTNMHVKTSIGVSPTSGGFNPRQMNLGATGDMLNYNLYTDSARTTIWGDGTQGTSYDYQLVKKSASANLIVYGRIPASQDVSTGQYSDTLVVQIDY